MKHIPVFYIYIFISQIMNSPVWVTELNSLKRDFPSSLKKSKIRLLLYQNFLMRKKKSAHQKQLTFDQNQDLEGILRVKNKIIFPGCSFSDVIRQGKLGTLWKTLCLHIIRLWRIKISAGFSDCVCIHSH